MEVRRGDRNTGEPRLDDGFGSVVNTVLVSEKRKNRKKKKQKEEKEKKKGKTKKSIRMKDSDSRSDWGDCGERHGFSIYNGSVGLVDGGGAKVHVAICLLVVRPRIKKKNHHRVVVGGCRHTHKKRSGKRKETGGKPNKTTKKKLKRKSKGKLNKKNF